MIAETWHALASTWGGPCMLTVVTVGWLAAVALRRLLLRALRRTALAGGDANTAEHLALAVSVGIGASRVVQRIIEERVLPPAALRQTAASLHL